MDYINENKKSYDKLYEKGWGNRYPDSHLISFWHNYIKHLLPRSDGQVKVLDFGCSLGANTRFFHEQGCDVYGIDISEIAVRKCVELNGFPQDHFKALDLLGRSDSLEAIFHTRFDLIIASEVLYYFSPDDIKKLRDIFHDGLVENGVIYANWVTYNHHVYKKYKGMTGKQIVVEATGSADEKMYDYIIEDKAELQNIFSNFTAKYIKRTVIELDEENESLHYIGVRSN